MKKKFWFFILVLAIGLWASRKSTGSVGGETQAKLQMGETHPAATPGVRLPASVNAATLKTVAIRPLQNLVELKKCYQSLSCPFSQEDPRSYDFAVGQALQKEIRRVHSQLKGQPGSESLLKQIAHEFIQVDDGYVQEAAFDVFADLPPEEENLRAITDALNLTDDPTLMERAIGEFQRYLGRSEEPLVHEFLQKFLQSGAHLASQETAKLVLPFLNSNSFEGYEKVYLALPKSTQVSQDLRTALEEYQNLVSGG